MPVVDVLVDREGGLTIRLDGAPYEADQPLERGHLQSVIAQITSELQSPVRVDVVEADGTAYADIATPAEPAPSASGLGTSSTAAADTGAISPGFGASGLVASGFDPGEEVAIAYVLTRHAADPDGATSLQLPPTILAARRGGLVLLGLSSGRVTALSEAR